MHLWLVRHGQSEPNPVTPDWGLSAQGAREARRIGERLASAGITHILSSPLLRALATAQIIAEVIDHRPVEVWLDLREGYDHDYHGSSRADLLAQFPRASFPADMPDAGWAYSGDTPDLFLARCQRILVMLRTRFTADDHVVVLTHGGFANYLLHTILHIPAGAPIWFEMANGALTTVRFVPEQDRRAWPLYPAIETEILTLNDIAHLSGLS